MLPCLKGFAVKLPSCCEDELSGSVRSAPTVGQRCAAAAGWVVPSATLALLPKCPACLAGYIAIATGMGISLTAAKYLRFGLIVLCIGALAYFATRWIAKWQSRKMAGKG
jgi:hypothetical protein